MRSVCSKERFCRPAAAICIIRNVFTLGRQREKRTVLCANLPLCNHLKCIVRNACWIMYRLQSFVFLKFEAIRNGRTVRIAQRHWYNCCHNDNYEIHNLEKLICKLTIQARLIVYRQIVILITHSSLRFLTVVRLLDLLNSYSVCLSLLDWLSLRYSAFNLGLADRWDIADCLLLHLILDLFVVSLDTTHVQPSLD